MEADLGSIAATIETVSLNEGMDGGLDAWMPATSLSEIMVRLEGDVGLAEPALFRDAGGIDKGAEFTKVDL